MPHSHDALKALIGESKLRESKLRESLKRMTQTLHKARVRERRAKKKVSSLLEDLRLHDELNEELKSKLDYFSGKMTILLLTLYLRYCLTSDF